MSLDCPDGSPLIPLGLSDNDGEGEIALLNLTSRGECFQRVLTRCFGLSF